MSDCMPTCKAYSFIRGGKVTADLSTDPRLALLAGCVADQQRAGFGNHIDLREARCPDCKEPGFNTGHGFWVFTCGAETLTDGEPCRPCPHRSKE